MVGWLISILNRGVFVICGLFYLFFVIVILFGSDLEYYWFIYQVQKYFLISNDWIFWLCIEIGFGNGFGNVDQILFYDNYYVGGFGLIWGYEDCLLGLCEMQFFYDFGIVRVIGGNLLMEGSVEFIFLMLFVKDLCLFCIMFFIDVGNVFDMYCEEYEFEFD